MAREKLPNELVECPDDKDAYYKVTVYRSEDGCTATIPGIGKVIVAKDLPEYPWQCESFAWKIKK